MFLDYMGTNKDWSAIAIEVGRTPADSRDRYKNHLEHRNIRVSGEFFVLSNNRNNYNYIPFFQGSDLKQKKPKLNSSKLLRSFNRVKN